MQPMLFSSRTITDLTLILLDRPKLMKAFLGDGTIYDPSSGMGEKSLQAHPSNFPAWEGGSKVSNFELKTTLLTGNANTTKLRTPRIFDAKKRVFVAQSN